MKIIFAGSPEFAVPALRALAAEVEIVAVLTQPDRPVGRKRVITPTPVKQAAESLGLKVVDFERSREHAQSLKDFGADMMITCAYGQLLTQEILDIFPHGVWNLHASLLPKFRGASPIQSAILAGESHTGITVMRTELKLDCGDILLVKRIEIGDDTCGALEGRLSLLAAEAAIETVKLLSKGDEKLLLQDETKATFCKKITKENCKIDFSLTSGEVVNRIKAFSPQPLAYCLLGGVQLNIIDGEKAEGEGKAGEVIKADREILVACGEGAVRLTFLQLSGGKALSARDFLNGRKIKVGDILE